MSGLGAIPTHTAQVTQAQNDPASPRGASPHASDMGRASMEADLFTGGVGGLLPGALPAPALPLGLVAAAAHAGAHFGESTAALPERARARFGNFQWKDFAGDEISEGKLAPQVHSSLGEALRDSDSAPRFFRTRIGNAGVFAAAQSVNGGVKLALSDRNGDLLGQALCPELSDAPSLGPAQWSDGPKPLADAAKTRFAHFDMAAFRPFEVAREALPPATRATLAIRERAPLDGPNYFQVPVGSDTVYAMTQTAPDALRLSVADGRGEALAQGAFPRSAEDVLGPVRWGV